MLNKFTPTPSAVMSFVTISHLIRFLFNYNSIKLEVNHVRTTILTTNEKKKIVRNKFAFYCRNRKQDLNEAIAWKRGAEEISIVQLKLQEVPRAGILYTRLLFVRVTKAKSIHIFWIASKPFTLHAISQRITTDWLRSSFFFFLLFIQCDMPLGTTVLVFRFYILNRFAHFQMNTTKWRIICNFTTE